MRLSRRPPLAAALLTTVLLVTAALLAGCGAEAVIDGIRALNPGSTGLPRSHGIANWLLVEDDGDQLAITHRGVPYDAGAVASDLRHRRHPNAEFITSILTGARQL